MIQIALTFCLGWLVSFLIQYNKVVINPSSLWWVPLNAGGLFFPLFLIPWGWIFVAWYGGFFLAIYNVSRDKAWPSEKYAEHKKT